MVDIDIPPAILDKAMGAASGLGVALLAWFSTRRKDSMEAEKNTMDNVKSLQALQKDFAASLMAELNQTKAELSAARKDNSELHIALAQSEAKRMLAEHNVTGDNHGPG